MADEDLIGRLNAIGDRLENGQRAHARDLLAHFNAKEREAEAHRKFVAQALGKIAERLGGIESVVDALSGRVDKLEHTSSSLKANFYDVVSTLSARVGVLETQVNRLAAQVVKNARAKPTTTKRKKK